MFKKNTWIAVLLVALVMMFVSCIDAVVEEEGDIVEIFRLSKVIADVEDGVLDGDEGWNAVFADTPLAKCGSATFSIITEGGKKKLQIGNMINTWGEGLDICNEAGVNGGKNSGVGFRAGDKITLKGWTDHAGMYMNAKGGAHGDTDNWQSPGGDFDHELTLTTAIVGTIRQGNPQVIRLHYHNNVDRKGTIKFEEIVVEGPRSGTEDVYLDDFEITDLTQAQYWVTGVNIKPKTGKTAGDITISYKSEDDDDVAASWTTDLTKVQTEGTYDVKFDVKAAKGFNAASFGKVVNYGTESAPDMGYIQMKVIPIMPNPVKVDLTDADVNNTDGANKNIITANYYNSGTVAAPLISGSAGKKWVFLYNGNWFDPADFMPMAIKDYLTVTSINSSWTPRIVLNFEAIEPDWRAFSTVTITYDLIETTCFSVQTGDGAPGPDSDGGHPSTNVNVRNNNAGIAYGNGGADAYPNFSAGEGQKYTRTVASVNTATNITGLVFTKNHNGTGVLIRITGIEFAY